ncbi:MAG: GFA family protein [Pseudomonadota bacterium]|nr:GFA family protein [Pseudomonadota bacterium]
MTTGHCLCGKVSYRLDAGPIWIAYCHCASCRRHAGSPVTLFAGMREDRVVWTGADPDIYQSSPGVERLFCGQCGTPVAYRAERFPGELHLYHGTLDTPAAFPPAGHVHAGGQLPWFEIDDRLPRYESAGGPEAMPVSIGPARKAS